ASYFRNLLDKKPLDITAETLMAFAQKPQVVAELFGAYEDFLAILSKSAQRDQLEKLTPEELETDQVYAEARKVSHRFQDAVAEIFLKSDNPIGELTIRYGVF
ncbi:MAG: hypothetical protein ACRDF4_08135, partial [Rhabdochlamydiaceae bacterium]